MSDSIGLCILGSTGSIGTQTLQIVDAMPERFHICSLSAFSNTDLLISQARKYRPARVAVGDSDSYHLVKNALTDIGIEVVGGEDAARTVAAHADAQVVVAAIVGFAGLRPVLAALERGAKVALANKETLVAAGALVSDVVQENGGVLLPVDSEHSAIFRCMQGEERDEVRRIILTASGGPFRTRSLESLSSITVDEALAHPNWEMGAKITIDSATMMNKGLEVIEAHWLFDCSADEIDVLIHPQSIVHSMVEFVDGATKAQLGQPDMRVPIQYALMYPERAAAENPRIDWTATPRLDFFPPDEGRFPCLGLAYASLRAGGSAPAALNAANEAVVTQFLSGEIRFVDIAPTIEMAVAAVGWDKNPDLQSLIEVDAEARRRVLEQKRKTHH